MSKIQNMRVISDNPDLRHFFSFGSVRLGTVEEIDGKKYRVIDNSQTTVVTYEPVEE